MTKLGVLVLYLYVWRYVDGLPFGHTMLNGREAGSLDDIVVRELCCRI